MQVQIMPKLISTVDQTPTSKNSQVGFKDCAQNETIDWRRRMLTTVTLGAFNIEERNAEKDLQTADTEHHSYANHSLPM